MTNKVQIGVEAAVDQAVDALNKVSKATGDVGDKADKSKGGFQKLNGAMEQLTGVNFASAVSIAGVGIALKAGIDFAKGSIDSASDLNETMSKSSVVFGDAAGAIEAMGNTAAVSLGMSKNAAISAAATYGNLFVSMGMGKGAAAEMSIGLVQLASDLGSFNNMASTDVLEKLRAGLTGETEPLKSLGVNLNAAAVEAEAMRLGLKKAGEELTAAAKAQATYSLILQQTTTAQGDYKNTSMGVANQTKSLEAQTEDLTASIGKGLLPAWLEVLKVGNQVITFFTTVVTRTEKANAAFTELATKTITSATTFDQFKEALRQAGYEVSATGEIVVEEGEYMGKALHKTFLSAEEVKSAFERMQTAGASKEATWAMNALRKEMNLTAQDMGGNQKAYDDFIQRGLVAAKDKMDLLTGSMGTLSTAALYQKAIIGMDAEAALALGVNLGLVDSSSYNAQKQVMGWQQALKDGRITVEEYTKLVSGLVGWWDSFGDKHVNLVITVDVNGDPIPDPYDQGEPPGGDYHPIPTQQPGGTPGDPGGDPRQNSRSNVRGISNARSMTVNVNGWSGDPASLVAEIARRQQLERLMA
jgi:hypothetical protein